MPPTEEIGPARPTVWDHATSRSFIESPLPAAELTEAMHAAGSPTLGFFLMLGLATAIGTSGMMANSAGVIIGAMIVAPLMNPILALSFCLARASWRRALLALLLLLSGVVLTVLLAWVGTVVAGLRVAGSEILGRTQPTLLDLLVAIAAGGAAAFANTRKSIANVLPGTAIAVALVPPLCVVGIGLGAGHELVPEAGIGTATLGPDSTGFDVAFGALILFLTNLAGIVLAAEFVFLLNGYGSAIRGGLGIAVTFAAAAALCYPLGGSLHDLYSRSEVMRVASEMMSEQRRRGATVATILDVRVSHQDGVLVMRVEGVVPEAESHAMRDRMRDFQQRLSAVVHEPVRVHAQAMIVPIDAFTLEPEPP